MPLLDSTGPVVARFSTVFARPNFYSVAKECNRIFQAVWCAGVCISRRGVTSPAGQSAGPSRRLVRRRGASPERMRRVEADPPAHAVPRGSLFCAGRSWRADVQRHAPLLGSGCPSCGIWILGTAPWLVHSLSTRRFHFAALIF